MRALLWIVMLAACESQPAKPAPQATAGNHAAGSNAAPATGSTAPKFDAKPGARTPPKVSDSCDGGCTLTDVELVDNAPGTYACCPGCRQTAVNAASYQAFQAWCQTSPAPQCPPLGCIMPNMRAECEQGHCVAKDARATIKP